MPTISDPKPATRFGFLIASLLCFVAGAIALSLLIPFLLGATRPSRAEGGSIVTILLLYAPFAVIALLAASVEKRTSRMWAIAFFGFFACILGGLYFRGYWYSEIAMMERKWTAAALSIGLLPFQGVAVIAVAGVIALVIRLVKGSTE